MAEKGMDRGLIRKYAARVPFFSNFSGPQIDQIVEDFNIVSVGRGDDIVLQSGEDTDFYLILKGMVKVRLLGPEGNEFVLTTFREGDFFGEMSLIDGKSRSANVVAEEDTSLGVLRRDIFVNTIKQNPSIAYNLLGAVVERLRRANDLIETLAFLDVNERIVRFLIDNAVNNGNMDESGVYKVRKRTHQDIASNIGSSREAVSKALKVLAYKKIVIEEKGIFLVSPDACEQNGIHIL